MTEISNLKTVLKRSGYKATPTRLAVIQVLENTSGHLSHQQILDQGRKIFPKLSRATVYRTMELFVALGLVRPLYLNDATQRFISAQGGHHHLICSDCGETYEFDICQADEIARELMNHYNFQITSHLLEFRGLCQQCRS